jgi:uncharacterized protein DUF5677
MGIKIEPNDALRDDLEHQLRIAPELENFVKTTMVGLQESTTTDRRKACIFKALASKSFTTFRAIVTLLQTGSFLEDSAVLVRVWYESTMTATYLLYSDEQAVDDYADFFMYRNWRDHQLVKELDPMVADKAICTEDLKTMESQFNEVGVRYRNGKWTALSAEAMARFADEHLPDGYKVFAFLYASIYRQSSAYVHSDVRSIQAQFHENAGEIVQISQPISKEHAGKLMYAANFLMLTICFVVSGTFYGTKHIPQWNSLVLRWNGTAPLG